MKKICFLIFAWSFGLAAYSQTAVSSSGGNSSNTEGYQQSYTIGQTATESFVSEDASVLLGIQQDFFEQKTKISVNQIPDIDGTMSEILPDINLNEFFFTDNRSKLLYEVSSSNESVVKTMLNDTVLSFVQYGAGTSEITVTASDGKGVSETVVFSVEVIADVQVVCKIDVAAKIEHVNCYGDKNGQIVLSVSGGVKPYSYMWNTGRTDNCLFNSAAGAYSVIVTDSVGCSVTKLIEINQNEAIQITEELELPSCGNADGKISVAVNGGIAPYSILWDDNMDGLTKENLLAGKYQLTVTDAKGCKTAKSIMLNNSESPVVEILNVTETKCGENTGEISAQISGGAGDYQYVWNDGVELLERTALERGEYTLTVTDSKNCKAVGHAVVEMESFRIPEIALVTVGEESGKNLIVWQKEETDVIAYYTVWRESWVSGEYSEIGRVDYNELGLFRDEEADINEQSWRYKISATDKCGNESPLSREHKTMHLQKNLGLTGEVNLVWDNYEGIAHSTYCLYRKLPTGLEEFKKVPASVNRYTDLNPPKKIKGYYVAVLLQDTIDITKPLKAESGPFVMAISNIAEVENDDPDAITVVDNNFVVSVVEKTIYVSNLRGQKVSVYDVAGQCIHKEKTSSVASISVSVPGTYLVKVDNEKQTVIVK
ncbi:MAG: SprB repeat-containing protein [Bacteroidales bacterium]|nr:SprB repeat-containing protein [Bacteroidales bacterium]